MKALTIVFFGLLFLLSACKKNAVGTATAPPTIYIAGTNVIADTNTVVYWKNGVMTSLTTGEQSSATAMIVSGNDVYIAGNEISNDSEFVSVWKNDVITRLKTGTSN